MEQQTTRQKIADIYSLINIHQIAGPYFNRSAGWLYHKIDQRIIGNKEVKFTDEEVQQFKAALQDIALRIRTAADNL